MSPGLAPDSSEVDLAFADWVAGIEDRLRAGERVDLDAEASRRPEWAERFRSLIASLERLGRQRFGMAELDAATFPREFRPVREIGRGGMGVVYEAMQISLNRRVALKVLPPGLARDAQRLKRFEIEARAAALLTHPHIVPVHLVGAEGGIPYYAMRYVEGWTLAEVLADARRAEAADADPDATQLPSIAGARGLSPKAVARLGQQAAEALHYAHEQGIVHRDIKPSNLMVEPSGWLWVLDFGLARLPEGGDLTGSGVLMGTLRYASPEQALGERSIVDQRADVYSLGATLYELLTRRPAFTGEDRLDLLRRIATAEPERPRRIDRTIPPELETIVLTAMAKSPDDRYQSAGALAEDLSRFLEGRPILARPPGPIDLVARWGRRNGRAAATLAGLAAFVVAVLGTAVVWHNRSLSRLNDELRSALGRAEKNETASRRLWYGSRIRLAQQELAAGRPEFAQEVLEELRPARDEPDLRGFEWRYLHRLAHRDVSLLFGHEAPIYRMAVSPDGRSLVTGDRDGSVILWDLTAWRERWRVSGLRNIQSLHILPAGRGVVVRVEPEPGRSNRLAFLDPETGAERLAIPSTESRIWNESFSPDGRSLVIDQIVTGRGKAGQVVDFWDVSEAGVPARRASPPISCEYLALSPDGRRMVTTLGTDPISLRDAADGRVLATLPWSSSSVTQLGFTLDGRMVASETAAGEARYWEIATGREFGPFPPAKPGTFCRWNDGTVVALPLVPGGGSTAEGPRAPLRPMAMAGLSGDPTTIMYALSPDGRTIAAAGRTQPPTLWDAATGRERARYPEPIAGAHWMAFTPDGRSLAFAGEDARVRSWHFAPPDEPNSRLEGHAAEVWSLAFTPNGEALASSGDDHRIRIWNPRDGSPTDVLEGHGSLVTSIAINRDGTLLASAGFDRTVRIWDLPARRLQSVLEGHADSVRAVAFGLDGRTVASAGSDGEVRLWSVRESRLIRILGRHPARMRGIAFHPSDAWLASAGDDRPIRVYDPSGVRPAIELGSNGKNSTVVFSPDGSLLASADDFGNAHIWEVAGWTRRASVKGSGAAVWDLAFSPDGRSLAAACGDGKVRVWDPTTAQLMLVIDAHSQRVNAVAFSPDGQTLASAGHDGVVKLWRAGER